jgi:drug/metabolite transporter (DMT)-like permease
MRKTVLVTAVVVLSSVLGNLSLSWGMRHQKEGWLLSPLLNPWVMLGIALLILWTFSRMTLLSWADLSYVLPITAVGYVLTAAAGHFVMGEYVSGARWLGAVLIMAGVALVGRTEPRSTGGPQ